MYSANNYWDSHGTMSGKRDAYSQGSVADRGGEYDKPAFSIPSFGANPKGYGFGKTKKKAKKKAKRLGGGY
jgi:hypothetical protein